MICTCDGGKTDCKSCREDRRLQEMKDNSKIKTVQTTQYEYDGLLYDTIEAAQKAEEISKLGKALDEVWFRGCDVMDIIADLYDLGVRVNGT